MLPGHKKFSRKQQRIISPPVLGLLACLCAISNEAHCDIYSFTDAGGIQHFSNVPTDARYVLAWRTEQPATAAKSAVLRSHGFDRSHQKQYAPAIKRAARTYRLDPALLHAVIATESGYDVNAVSDKGAMGLMQLMPETAKRYGATDPFNPDQNIRAGAQYLNSLLQRFGNDLNLALAAYNSGEGNVVKYGKRIPPFPETVAYVPRVMGLYRKYQRVVW
ncbi:MAG: lytic transglycosylase domain-containing protein [Gammaproteobacteria bacterium]|nr:lytic transglycosylase domain-containing protein [Gammaproteobacteria bacterium]MBU1482924.1 lytic transglycosylase domain-containing protein [Gammaproteobacteria bacterium]